MAISPHIKHSLGTTRPAHDLHLQAHPDTSLRKSGQKVANYLPIITGTSTHKTLAQAKIYRVTKPSLWKGLTNILQALKEFVCKILIRLGLMKGVEEGHSQQSENADIEELSERSESPGKIRRDAPGATAAATNAAATARASAEAALKAPDYPTALIKVQEAAEAAEAADEAAESAHDDTLEYSAALAQASAAASALLEAAKAAALKARTLADSIAEDATPTTPTVERKLLGYPPRSQGRGVEISTFDKLVKSLGSKPDPDRTQLDGILKQWIDSATDDDRSNFIKAAQKILAAYDANATTLQVRYLNLPYLPEEIFLLKRFRDNIVEVDFSGNALTLFPLELLVLKKLEKIYLDSNQIEEIPTQIVEFWPLKTLNLSSNKIASLPTQLGSLENLRYLTLNGNKIRKIPRQMEHLVSLRSLDLCNNLLTTLPPKIIALPDLAVLMISGNMIDDVPEMISKKLCIYNTPSHKQKHAQPLPRTVKEFLAYSLYETPKTPQRENQAPEIHPTTQPTDTPLIAATKANIAAKAAEDINTSNGPIGDYSAALAQAAAAAEATVESAAYMADSAAKAAEEAAAAIIVTTPPTPLVAKPRPPLRKNRTPGTGNHIGTPVIERIKGFFGIMRDEERFSLAKTLNQWINDPGLDTTMEQDETESRKRASKKIVEAYDTDATCLKVIGTGISHLPKGIINNKKFRQNLVEVELGSNKLDEFPRDLLALKNLKSLSLHGNKITVIPTQIEGLTQLVSINIALNQISMIPTQIGKLQKLKILDVGGNKIHEIPEQVSELKELTDLDVTSNYIEEVPANILTLPKLRFVAVGNQKKEAQPSIWGLPTPLEMRIQLEKMSIRRKKMGW